MSPHRRFPNDAASVSAARRFVLGALDGISPGDADAVAVMVSELAANAVRHTESHFTVAVDRSPERIRVAVSDGGSGDPVIRAPYPEEPSGRGLQIVQALSAEWGVIPAGAMQGKTVWFAIPVDISRTESLDITQERAEPIERRDPRTRDSGAFRSTGGGGGAPANYASRPRSASSV